MADSTHFKNLANIDNLIDFVTQLGATYNPTNPQLTVAGLTALKTQITTDYNNWTSKFTTYKADTNTREITFKPIDKLCTAILDNVKTLNVAQQTINDVSSLVTKIHGNSSKTKKPSAGRLAPPANPNDPAPSDTPIPAPTTISTSQQSYDSLIANFDKLVQQAQNISSYTPNETNIQVSNLQTLFTTLNTVNLNAITATNAVNLARNQRNMSFYGSGTGLCDIAKKVKLYVRQVYGTTSPQYHQIAAIKFTRIKIK
jgi:hypothetical protein